MMICNTMSTNSIQQTSRKEKNKRKKRQISYPKRFNIPNISKAIPKRVLPAKTNTTPAAIIREARALSFRIKNSFIRSTPRSNGNPNKMQTFPIRRRLLSKKSIIPKNEMSKPKPNKLAPSCFGLFHKLTSDSITLLILLPRGESKWEFEY